MAQAYKENHHETKKMADFGRFWVNLRSPVIRKTFQTKIAAPSIVPRAQIGQPFVYPN